MDKIQEVTLQFFGPITIAYLAACALILLSLRLIPKAFDQTAEFTSDKPYLDAGLGLAGAVAILMIGNYLRIDTLFGTLNEPWKGIVWIITNLEIYLPILLVLLYREQGPSSIYLSKDKLGVKILIGLGIAVVSSLLFLLIRGEASRILPVARSLFAWKSLTNFPAIFMEGVAIAFLFVRLRWAFGSWVAVLVPAILFAGSHIPRSLQDGESVESIVYFFFLNTGICAFVLVTCSKTKDVICLGLVHYMLDMCIKAIGP